MSIFREIFIFIGIFFSIMIIRLFAGKALVSSLNLPNEYSLLLTLFSYAIGAILYCLVVIKLEKRSLRSIGFSKDNITIHFERIDNRFSNVFSSCGYWSFIRPV